MGYFLFMLFLSIGVFVLLSCVIGIYSEYVRWNGGVCPHTGGSWMYQGEDESGAHVYYSGDYKLTVNWTFIDKNVNQ